MPSESVKIITNRMKYDNVYQMEVPFQGKLRPGQFFMLRAENAATLLPRPISVCDYRDGILTFLYQVVGKGTAELAALGSGNQIHLTGPLGNGFPVGELAGAVALVAGGIGIAPMLLTARLLRETGCKVICLAGFKEEPLLAEELTAVSDQMEIATESGRHGSKGFVTSILRPEAYSAVLCCGPEPMMKAVAAQCESAGTPVYVSMEKKMACGVGGCLVCSCAAKGGKNLRACADGPVFRGEDMDFDA